MKHTRIKDIVSKTEVGSQVVIKGWVKSVRTSKNFAFVVINDGSTQHDFQSVVDESSTGFEECGKLVTGYCVALTGTLVMGQGKIPQKELQAKSLEVIGSIPEDYPIQKKATSLEFLREIAHLRARTNTFGAVFRVRHVLAAATHQFFDQRGFYYIHTPVITASDCEGAGEMFRVSTLSMDNPPRTAKGEVDWAQDYFGKPTYLTVSGQLEGEAYALSLGQVYTFGPTFRSENSNTSRHLAEFWMIEPEVAFADLDDVAQLAADYVQFMIKMALERCPDELAFFEKMYKPGLIETLTHVRDSAFVKVTYTEAVDIIQKADRQFEYAVQWGSDLQSEHERYLAEEHFKKPVIVTDYPKEIKSFYMKLNSDGKTVRAMDVLVPGIGELIGGSQREDDVEKLRGRMKDVGLNEEDYKWYLDLRRFGSAPHAGFGLGFERAVMYITGMSNIRDVIPFARTPKNCEF